MKNEKAIELLSDLIGRLASGEMEVEGVLVDEKDGMLELSGRFAARDLYQRALDEVKAYFCSAQADAGVPREKPGGDEALKWAQWLAQDKDG